MAVAAAATAVHPSPPALARRTVASLLCIHLAWAAVDAVICLFLASMWFLFLGVATKEIGRLACGEGCAVVTAAYKVIPVAVGVTLALVFPLVVLLTARAMVMARLQAAAATATDTEATKEAVPKTPYAAMREVLCDSLNLGLLASSVFTLLMPIGILVKGDSPVMGSRQERMGSAIYDVGALGTAMVNCFVSCPIITVRIWRGWTMARAWRKGTTCSVMWYAVETKP